MSDLFSVAERVFNVESRWLQATLELNRSSFSPAVRLLKETTGKIVVCGMGKSGIVARKIAATMTSTGNPAYFLHPAEGIHGDLGILSRGDTALILSKSGDTEEIAALLPALRRLEIPVVAIVANDESILGRFAGVVLRLPVLNEACPWNLAPTASTTAMMAMGDALAMAMLELSGFSPDDFAEVHPGGALGRKLLMKVEDLMVSDSLPVLSMNITVADALETMTVHRGICIAVSQSGALEGVFVYGDLGRLMKSGSDVRSLKLSEVMTPSPSVCRRTDLVSLAVQEMERKGITSLVVVSSDNRPEGVLYLHDALIKGF
ncbi:D-arabinose 5-phosphate isomerase [Candidatus Fermentibacteria bacterium]|nr:MAG: D-arabinose 5-phosphate isomerase [Candidatus Fermentibacteria bacterium]